MSQIQKKLYIGLDVGTSMVRCAVGVPDPSGEFAKLSIIGYGEAINNGMRKGSVVHVNDVSDAIVRAINQAEQISGDRIRSVTVNVNGSHVVGINSKGVIAISSTDKYITEQDRTRVEQAAALISLPVNREIVQFFAKNYNIDGQSGIKDPIGMQGVRLEVEAHIVTAATPNLRNLNQALEVAEINVDSFTFAGLASAEVLLTRQQKEAGTLLMDIGAGTTNLMVIEDGEVQYVGVLPIGGINLTNDLAIGLKTELEVAEQVKIRYASLNLDDYTTRTVEVKYDNRLMEFDLEDIQLITSARIEELLEQVEKELVKIKKNQKLPGGVVLTGGTSKLPGLADFVKSKLSLATRVGKIQNMTGLVESLDNNLYATAVGLMTLDLLLAPLQNKSKNNSLFGLDTSNNMANKLMSRFKKRSKSKS